MVEICIGLDVHKNSVYATQLKEDGSIGEQYEFKNSEESWLEFKKRYIVLKPEIALEVSTSGKYVARLLRDMGFSVHMADPVKLALIFNTARKNDKEDSYKLAKLLRLGELPEVHLPSRESDDLRSLVRYRKSLGEEITRIKNRVHALLSVHGITLKQADIFGKSGLVEIDRQSVKLSPAERIVLDRLLSSVIQLRKNAIEIEDEMARLGHEREDVRLLMTIPGINVYSAVAIISEIDDMARFRNKEKFASYTGLTPRQDQSGSRDIRGHVSKHGPSMLRFILVTAAHSAIKYSKRMKQRYLRIVRRTGMKRAIVAIARILAETVYTMLSRNVEFIDSIDSLTERKMAAMSVRAKRPAQITDISETVRLLRAQRVRGMSEEPFS